MGLLDNIDLNSVTSKLGDSKDLQNGLNSVLEKVMGKDHPDIGSMLKSVDTSKIGDLLSKFKRDGLPEKIEELKATMAKYQKRHEEKAAGTAASTKPAEKK